MERVRGVAVATPKTCAYTYEPRRFKCKLPVWEGHDTLCILHDPRKEKDKERFKQTLDDRIASAERDENTRQVDLTGVVFPGPLRWAGRTVPKAISFEGAQFMGAARFRGAHFTGDARFNGAQFTGAARFDGAHFTGDAWFGGAQFTGAARFDGAQFTGAAWFGGAQFTGAAWFDGAQFTGDAWFHGAQFTGVARFYDARFAGDAWFRGAQFTGDAWFHGAQFAGDAWFHGAQFTGDAWFHGAQFTGDARFDGAHFTESLLFQGKTFPAQQKVGRVEFVGAAFAQPHRAYFRGVDLSRASFQNTDITHVQFAGCTWATGPEHAFWPLLRPAKPAKRMSARRQVIREHLELTAEEGNKGQETRPSHQAVAEQYRMLRLNYEGSKQEIEAGDFYIGQMDMRRLDKKEYPSWLYRRLLDVYRTVALYGESYIRPLVFYVLFGLLFAWAYQWRGCASYADGLFTALTAGALFRDVPVCIDDAEKILVYFNTLLDTLLLGLALVALRRRFHR
ncbi:MAG: pentapeptide repeat-containing protein [Chloroflexota bacterium]|nr:pentapeptide repeat-containing protein [Chloroflexota bacterium]